MATAAEPAKKTTVRFNETVLANNKSAAPLTIGPIARNAKKKPIGLAFSTYTPYNKEEGPYGKEGVDTNAKPEGLWTTTQNYKDALAEAITELSKYKTGTLKNIKGIKPGMENSRTQRIARMMSKQNLKPTAANKASVSPRKTKRNRRN